MGNHWPGKACAGTLLAAVLLLAWPGPWPAAASVSTLIVPGEALGPARLGMSLAELIAVLGSSVPEADGQVKFPLWAVTAAFQNGLAVRLTTTNPLFRTRRGAGVGTDLSQATHLIGDLNFVSTAYGRGTTSLYPFQGIGFVFRPHSAAEVYIVERIELSLRKPPAPPAQAILQAPQAYPEVAIRDLTEAVDATTGLLRVMGRVVNIGSQPATPVTVTATFERINGDDSWKQLVLSQPIAPGADAPFRFETFVRGAIVARYTIGVTVGTPGNVSTPVQETRSVPPAVYAEFARQVIELTFAEGPPSATARIPAVQFLASISGTGPIPREWVKDVRVEILLNPPTGSQEIHLVPSQIQTIVVPLSRPLTWVVSCPTPSLLPVCPPGAIGFIPVQRAIVGVSEALVATAEIKEVLLGAP